MKIVLCVVMLAAVSAMTVPFATGQSKQTQEGIIINVQKQEVATPPVRTGADPVRTPLQSRYYLYNISVQLNCDVYVARYETEFNDSPAALSPHSRVPVRLEKHSMYLDFPGDTVKMQIVRHKVSREGSCGQTPPAN